MSGLIDPDKALALFRDGATIVFQGLHRYHQPLADLVAEVDLELCQTSPANAYHTPPGWQGEAVQRLTKQLFVFQTAGAKDWEVIAARDTGRTVEAITMEPGLSLYLPTSTPHAARAQQAVSLHVTIGINQLTWRGLLRRTVEGLLPPDDHLPAGYLDDPGALQDGLADRLRELADAISGVDADEAAEAEVRRFLTTRPVRVSGGLLDAVTEIGDDTVLRRRAGRPCVLRRRAESAVPEGRVDMLLGDRVLTLPARLQPVLQHIRAAASFTPAELELDEQSRLVLCRRLVREGLLEVAR